MRASVLTAAFLLVSGCFGGGNAGSVGDDPMDPEGGGGGGGGDCEIGDSFPAADGCNSCVCTADGIACTTRACDPDDDPPSGKGTCIYDGRVYSAGESFPADDGCNSCSCDASGAVSCTLKGCQPSDEACDGAGGCLVGGVCHADGEVFGDCDNCVCENGLTSCDDVDCAPPTDACPALQPQDSEQCPTVDVQCKYPDAVCVCGYGSTAGDQVPPPTPPPPPGDSIVAAPWWTCSAS